MKLKEMHERLYSEYKKQIDLISEVSEKKVDGGNYKVDIGVATEMFINYVKIEDKSIFVDVSTAKARIAELEAQLSE